MGGSRVNAVVGFVAAVIVLLAALAAALTKDDHASTRTSVGITTTSRGTTTTTTSGTTPTTAPGSTTTLKPVPGATATTVKVSSPTPSTAPPAVPSPEAAVNGLIAAYRAGNQEQAARFATADVVDALFAVPFSGDEGSFQGCTPSGELFACRYSQSATAYDMTAQRNPRGGSFLVVQIEVRGTGTTS
jgi:hypothetical protein